ncbi:putative fms-interacting protein [Lyophyllum shimeji]|uniref:Fms-interacting protein n=1 Tax=Lyophyllum shimeji TaxID=47721 RepID=A0A9P3PD85_LYOSH|nr:putative fms-interacting protein [Lyophyllum shimeji]
MPTVPNTAPNGQLGIPPSPDEVIDKLRDLVSGNHLDQDAAAIQIRAMALFGRLKALHRAANTATRVRKEATAQARHNMDESHLGLQNLLYEKRHLEREIEKCRQFASVYQDVPLYSLEEFKRLAPEEARSEDVLSDERQLMLNRLSFELAERQRLDQKRKELVQRKEDLLKESKTKAATMDNVKAQIDQLIKSAADTRKKIESFVPSIQTTDTTAPG